MKRNRRSLRQWKNTHENWLKSGKTQEAYCQGEGLSVATFKAKLTVLRKQKRVPDGAHQKTGQSMEIEGPNFVPIVPESRIQENESPYCQIQFREGGAILIE